MGRQTNLNDNKNIANKNDSRINRGNNISRKQSHNLNQYQTGTIESNSLNPSIPLTPPHPSHLDLVFTNQPPQIQSKLLKLLLQYNASLQYNSTVDRFQCDLVLMFGNQEERKGFIQALGGQENSQHLLLAGSGLETNLTSNNNNIDGSLLPIRKDSQIHSQAQSQLSLNTLNDRSSQPNNSHGSQRKRIGSDDIDDINGGKVSKIIDKNQLKENINKYLKIALNNITQLNNKQGNNHKQPIDSSNKFINQNSAYNGGQYSAINSHINPLNQSNSPINPPINYAIEHINQQNPSIHQSQPINTIPFHAQNSSILQQSSIIAEEGPIDRFGTVKGFTGTHSNKANISNKNDMMNNNLIVNNNSNNDDNNLSYQSSAIQQQQLQQASNISYDSQSLYPSVIKLYKVQEKTPINNSQRQGKGNKSNNYNTVKHTYGSTDKYVQSRNNESVNSKNYLINHQQQTNRNIKNNKKQDSQLLNNSNNKFNTSKQSGSKIGNRNQPYRSETATQSQLQSRLPPFNHSQQIFIDDQNINSGFQPNHPIISQYHTLPANNPQNYYSLPYQSNESFVANHASNRMPFLSQHDSNEWIQEEEEQEQRYADEPQYDQRRDENNNEDQEDVPPLFQSDDRVSYDRQGHIIRQHKRQDYLTPRSSHHDNGSRLKASSTYTQNSYTVVATAPTDPTLLSSQQKLKLLKYMQGHAKGLLVKHLKGSNQGRLSSNSSLNESSYSSERRANDSSERRVNDSSDRRAKDSSYQKINDSSNSRQSDHSQSRRK